MQFERTIKQLKLVQSLLQRAQSTKAKEKISIGELQLQIENELEEIEDSKIELDKSEE